MFSTKGEKDEIPFAIVNGGKSNGEIIYIKDEENNKTVVKSKPICDISVNDGKFELLPSEKIRVLYVSGPAGSGKSHFCGEYIHKYRTYYPNSPFYLFTQLTEDPALDDLDPHRITIDESLISNPIDLSEIPEHSIVLFDDVDSLQDKKLQQSINNTKKIILELGRKRDIKCLITAHLANGNDRANCRVILNETQVLVIFPKAGSSYQCKFILKKEFGMSNTQITKVLNLETRWVAIQKVYPQVVLSQHKAIFVNCL
jgi:hypothetical protein